MSDNLQRFALAFLAARCPGAYTADAICQRLNDSGMLDTRVTEDVTHTALQRLLRNGFVQSNVEPAGTRIYWNATPEGVKAWNDSGRIYVGR